MYARFVLRIPSLVAYRRVFFAAQVSVQSLLALYPYLLQDLSPRRTEELDDASAMGTSHPPPSAGT